MASKVITLTEVTDDITGQSISDTKVNGEEWARVRITIETIDQNGNVVNAEKNTIVKEIDTHQNVYSALVDFVNGRMMAMFTFLIAWYLGSTRAAAIMGYVRDNGETDAVISAFGGRSKPASNGSTSRKGGNAYTAYVRAYAAARGWKGSNGNVITVGGKGKLSQTVVLKFVEATGIKADDFATMTETEKNTILSSAATISGLASVSE